MDFPTPTNDAFKSFSFTTREQDDIKKSVIYELNKVQLLMIRLGGITNMFAALFVTFVLYGKVNTFYLVSWDLALFCINSINISYTYFFKKLKIDANNMGNWRHLYHAILTVLCITWGFVGIFFTSEYQYQIFTMTFLQIALVGFCFGTVTDFTASIIATVGVLTPYFVYRISQLVTTNSIVGYDPQLDFAFTISLLIIASFLLLVTFVGYQLLKNFFKLSLENVALSYKLGNMNKILENLVKERTAELEKSLKLVTYQSTHDILTDLPNELLLSNYIRAAIKYANQSKQGFSLVSFSINELDKIYDALGYKTAELTIKTIAHRFQKKFVTTNKLDYNDENDLIPTHYAVTLSRKNTFIILIQPILPHELEGKVEALFSVLEEPVYIGKQKIKLTASLGISNYPKDGREITSLMMNADAAMLMAKRQGGNSLNVYKAEINADVTRQLEVESHLQSAITNHEFFLQYQPFIDLKNGQICGMEALIRWKSPALGFISPMDFIPIAESNGLIIPLGEWVLRTACQQTQFWHKQGFNNLRVAINLSAKQLLHRNILKSIAKIIAEAGIQPEFIELELTETEAFQAETIPVINQLKKMGLRLSIDDFGTGYSGLSNLKLFSIDKLKIDKSFVQDVTVNSDSKAIVINTINLAKKLKVTVLAEGVETKEQLEFLKEHGCDIIQGYYFSPPVNSEDFSKILKHSDFFVKIVS